MKAIVQRAYGSPDLLRLEEVPTPTPGAGEVLVRVRASSVNFGNLAQVTGKPFMARASTGLMRPDYAVPGSDLAGQVEAVGAGVTVFRPGDEVYGDANDVGFGAWAEHARVPAAILARKPANMTFAEAAAVPQAALVALQALRDRGHLQTGQRVLIVGASSGNGTYAVQLAKALGGHVTAVCGTRNIDLVRSLGAERVIDYTHADLDGEGPRYDLVLGMAGYRPLPRYRRVLAPGGRYVSVGGAMAQILQGMLLGRLLSGPRGVTMTYLSHQPNAAQLAEMTERIERGELRTVIDRQFPIDQVAQALAHYAGGHASGKVVITVP